MRWIEKQIIEAIKAKRSFKSGNDEVSIVDGVIRVRLHGSTIARIGNGVLSVSSCGYQTATTKSRLNAILSTFAGVGITQRNFEWFVGDASFVDEMEFFVA